MSTESVEVTIFQLRAGRNPFSVRKPSSKSNPLKSRNIKDCLQLLCRFSEDRKIVVWTEKRETDVREKGVAS
jgi:hypothetical protein